MAGEVAYNAMKGKDVSTAALGTVKVMLIKVTAAAVYDPDVATISALLAAGGTECAFTNYSRKTVTISRTVDNATNRAVFSVAGGNVTWASAGAGETPVAAVWFDDNGSDATNVPISYQPFSPTVATDGSDYVMTVSNIAYDT